MKKRSIIILCVCAILLLIIAGWGISKMVSSRNSENGADSTVSGSVVESGADSEASEASVTEPEAGKSIAEMPDVETGTVLDNDEDTKGSSDKKSGNSSKNSSESGSKKDSSKKDSSSGGTIELPMDIIENENNTVDVPDSDTENTETPEKPDNTGNENSGTTVPDNGNELPVDKIG